MALFKRNPVKQLDTELTAGWLALQMPSRLDAQAKATTIVNSIYTPAKALSAQGRRLDAVTQIEGAKKSTDDVLSATWNRMLDTVIENL